MAEIKSLEDLGAAIGDAAVEGSPDGAVPAETGGNPPPPVYERKVDELGRSYATGKRKDAVARVWLKPGSGKITIQGAIKKRDVVKKNRKESLKATKERDFTEYFARPVLQMVIKQPLITADRETQFDIVATVSGGGLSGQAGALRHGISKALTYYEPELRGVLKAGGFLTRDSRVVERKKYGRAKARRSFQFSKR